MRIVQLVVLKFGFAILGNQTFRVDQENLSTSFFDRDVGFHCNSHGNQVGYACSCFTSAHEDKLVFGQSLLCQLLSGKQSSQHHTGSPLNVVVECTVRVLVLVQEAEGVRVAKVFELQINTSNMAVQRTILLEGELEDRI